MICLVKLFFVLVRHYGAFFHRGNYKLAPKGDVDTGRLGSFSLHNFVRVRRRFGAVHVQRSKKDFLKL